MMNNYFNRNVFLKKRIMTQRNRVGILQKEGKEGRKKERKKKKRKKERKKERKKKERKGKKKR